MRIGFVHIVDGTPGRGLEFIHQTASAAEELGFSSYWAPDHVVFFDEGAYASAYPHSEDGTPPTRKDQGLLEPIMVLQAAAQVTSTIKLGTSVEIITERNPVVRSKHVATLDQFSNGRFLYGVGIGWLREEYDAVGVPWERRGKRADEYIDAMKALWTQYRATYHGEFVSFTDVVAFPKPVQQPNPPVLVGGVTPAAIRRAVRHGDGWYGWKMTLPELDRALEVLDAELAEVGRSRDDGFHLYLGYPPVGDPADQLSYLKAVADRGIEDVVLGLSLSRTRYRETLESFARVLPLDPGL